MERNVTKLEDYNPKEHGGRSFVEYTLLQNYSTFEERLHIINIWADKLKECGTHLESLFICRVRQVMEFTPTEINDDRFIAIFKSFLQYGGKYEN